MREGALDVTARILVLEDEPSVAAAWSEVLVSHGYVVATTDELEAAWRMLTGRTFDLLVSDYHVRDGDVPTLCLRLAAKGIQTPMLLVTAAGDEARVRAAYGAGLYRVLRKPLPAADLSAAVTACLHNRPRSVTPSRRLIGPAERQVLLEAGAPAITECPVTMPIL